MIRPWTRRLAVCALSLSLAGCAAPLTATSPVASAPATEVATAAVAAPTPGDAAPAAPAVPALTQAGSATYQGKALFQGAALAGFALKAYQPLTGAELPLAAPATTDASGGFSVAIAAGAPYVRLVATQGDVTIEATFAAGKTDSVVLDEASTMVSQIAAGPLEVAGWLSADKVGPVAEAYMASIAQVQAPVAGVLAGQNAAAGTIVRAAATPKALEDQDAAYMTVLGNAGQINAVTLAAATLVNQVTTAGAAAPAAAFHVTDASGRTVRFRGTRLRANGGAGAPVTLTDTNGKPVDPSKPENVVKSTVKKVNHHRSASLFATGFPSGAQGSAFISFIFIFAVPNGMLPVEASSEVPGATGLVRVLSAGSFTGPAPDLEDGYKFDPDDFAGTLDANPSFDLAVNRAGEVKAIRIYALAGGSGDFVSVTPDLSENPGRDMSAPTGDLVLHFKRYIGQVGTPSEFALTLATNAVGDVVGYYLKPTFVENPFLLEAHRLDLLDGWPPYNPFEI